MLSKAKIKFVQSLKDKKHRTEHGLFMVEGNKNVAELLRSKIQVKLLITTHDWLSTAQDNIQPETEVVITDRDELKKVALTHAPQEAVAVACIPSTPVEPLDPRNTFVIALDTIQDPGNLGTIIRIADWYGISQLICSPGCADVYNPKVIQSTMGSFTRVQVIELDLLAYFQAYPGVSIYGALMNGNSVYQTPMRNGILLIGNEGNGIRPELIASITHPVTIPRIGAAESLNAAIATAICCDNRARVLSAI